MTKATAPLTRIAFAEALFGTYSNFLPTRSLYVDFEGSGGGLEDVLTLFWPPKPGAERVRWVVRKADEFVPDLVHVADALDSLEIPDSSPRHIVVFSGGVELPYEQERFEQAYGDIWGPSVKWLNLHTVLRSSRPMMAAIRKRRAVWRTGKRTADYSLEALEHEFGIVRPIDLRSASKSYADSVPGTLTPLHFTRQWATGEIKRHDLNRLKRYCRYDVDSMFKIARESEKLLFERKDRARRYRDFG